MKKIIASLVLGSLLLSPATALAVTPVMSPTTVIKNTLERAFWTKPDHGATITTNINYTEKDLKNVVVESGAAEIKYNYEVQYRANGMQNARFSLSLPKLNFTEKGKTQTWNNPLGIDVLSLGADSMYVRINHVSPEMQTRLKSFNVDLSSVVGKWISVPVDELVKDFNTKDRSVFGLDKQVSSFFTDEDVKMVKDWYQSTVKKSGSPLVITRLNRVTTNNAGEKVQTVRVTFNSKWYAALENLVIAEYKKENPKATSKEIAAERKKFNTDIAELKKILNKIQTDLTLNLTTGAISDVAVNYSSRDAEYTYDYKYVKGTYTSVKKLKGYSTLNVKTVANFRPVTLLYLEAPSYSLDGLKVWDMVYTKPAPFVDEECDITENVSDDAGVKADDYCANMGLMESDSI